VCKLRKTYTDSLRCKDDTLEDKLAGEKTDREFEKKQGVKKERVEESTNPRKISERTVVSEFQSCILSSRLLRNSEFMLWMTSSSLKIDYVKRTSN
jgi:hypothetical protein